MSRFGYEDLPDKLSGAGIHSLDNVLTLDISIRSLFDKLQLWFEAVVSGLQFSVLTLNVCRTARKTPIIFVWYTRGYLPCARQIQSHSKVHTPTFHCQTPSISGFMPHVVELPIYLARASTWTRFKNTSR